jgi:hypothetical protein
LNVKASGKLEQQVDRDIPATAFNVAQIVAGYTDLVSQSFLRQPRL